MSNRDDINMNDKKYENPNLLCCLDPFFFNLHNNIKAHQTYLVFGFLFVCSVYIYRNMGNSDDRLPTVSDSRPILVNCFIFTSKLAFF